jgi:dihydrofolate reductase
MARVVLLAAVAKNGVIGVRNELPWHLPEDLKRFKELTTGHTVVMGRKTFDSIMARLGKPLPNRKSVVITRDAAWAPPSPAHDVTVIHDIAAIRNLPGDVLWVIGGAEIYQLTMPMADELDITEVDLAPQGDAFFPAIDAAQWTMASGPGWHSEASGLGYRFIRYQRRHS